MEVAAASRTSRAGLAPDARLAVWLGFLEPGLSEATHFDGELQPTCLFTAGGAGDGYLPLGEALVEVAKDKFQSETAESGEPSRREAGERTEVDRLGRLEAAMETMAVTVKTLGDRLIQTGPRSSAADGRERPTPASKPSAGAPALPGLDPGVVQSALAAGVSQDALVEMSNLLSSNPALEGGSAARRRPGCFRRERCGANLRPRPGGRRIWISGSARRAADDSGGGPAREQGVQGFALGTGAGWGHHGRRRRGKEAG